MKILGKTRKETLMMKMKDMRTDEERPGGSIRRLWFPVALLSVIFLSRCVTEFVPEISEQKELLVVEALITDQEETYTVRLSRSLPFGKKSDARAVTGCLVTVSDDSGNSYMFREKEAGIYISDSTSFRGQPGRKYTLRINTYDGIRSFSYESSQVEMKPVPVIDTVYYEKTTVKEGVDFMPGIDACSIYLDTHDPANSCRYYRWDFTEVWVLRLLFPVPNIKCWIYDRSAGINIKSTAAFDEDRVSRQPVTYITNITDRLKSKYSIQVNQYSLNEDEYVYWRKLQNLGDEVGGLYDVIPASVPSNLSCIEDPSEKVLGYFSVSAKTSKRLFIKDEFEGIIDRYNDCISDTVYGNGDIPGLGTSVWILIDHPFPSHVRILTDKKGCYDCTVRGTTVRPPFWIGE